MKNETFLVRVNTIRSHDPRGFGGYIFTGLPIDGDGNILDAKQYYVIRAAWRHLNGLQVQRGQWWRIRGSAQPHVIEVNGFRITEQQIDRPAVMELVRPSGEHIVTLLAGGGFPGIGEAKARRLWHAHGEALVACARRGALWPAGQRVCRHAGENADDKNRHGTGGSLA